MNQPLVIRVQWSWGGSRIIQTRPFNIISETLQSYGFETIEGHQLIIAFQGKFIDPNFSFSHYNIKNGMRLILTLKKVKTKDRSRRFLERMNMQKTSQYPVIPFNPDHHDKRNLIANESGRMADLACVHLESYQKCSIILNQVLTLREKQCQNAINHTVIPIIETPKPDKILGEPLPIFFAPEFESADTNNQIRYNRSFFHDST